MKRRYLDILCCPHCRGELIVTEERTEGDEILEGTLLCKNCSRRFPIQQGTAILVPEGTPPEKVVPFRFVR